MGAEDVGQVVELLRKAAVGPHSADGEHNWGVVS